MASAARLYRGFAATNRDEFGKVPIDHNLADCSYYFPWSLFENVGLEFRLQAAGRGTA
jgi:hypothetical protein